MSASEFQPLFDGLNPVRLLDGTYALIIRFYDDTGEVGIQRPGGEDIVWMNVSKLHRIGNAFTEVL